VGRRHVLLVGLPGSGKTTVGRLAAATLGAPFVDLDAEVQRRAGKTIGRIFQEDGEPAFRSLEAVCGRDALGGIAAIVAAGGGFFEDAANRLTGRARGIAIYLQVEPSTAAARLEGGAVRPLLEGADPTARLAELLLKRKAGYLAVDHVVETDGSSAEQVARDVVSLARGHAGW
jgi:shikimate kinase